VLFAAIHLSYVAASRPGAFLVFDIIIATGKKRGKTQTRLTIMFLTHTLAFIGELHVANEEHKAFCSSTSSRHKLIYPTC